MTARGLSLLLLSLSATAVAADLQVITFEDELNPDGDCSLREAIQAANTNAAVDACPAGEPEPAVDRILLWAGTYLVEGAPEENANASGDLDLTSSVALVGQGPGLTYLKGTTQDRLLQVLNASPLRVEALTLHEGGGVEQGGCIRAAGSVTLQGVQLTDCSIAGLELVFGGAVYAQGGITAERCLVENSVAHVPDTGAGTASGGGLYGAAVTLRDCVIRNNRAINESSSGLATGGGVEASGAVEVTRTLFEGNSSVAPGTPTASGGAISVVNSSPGTVITDSTFTRNASEVGGAIAAHRVTLLGSTLHANAASRNAAAVVVVAGGRLERLTLVANQGPEAIWSATATTRLRNVLLTASQGSSQDVLGQLESRGYNLIQLPGALAPAEGDLLGSTAQTFPLADNQGPVPTLALEAHSAGLDQGACTDSDGTPALTDGRGYPRPMINTCDIGAYERQSVGPITVEREESPGTNCAEGGTRLELGVDQDGNERLERHELLSTQFVCGVPPASLNSAPEPEGANCRHGGTRVELGIDQDQDGALDPEEVESTRYLCNAATLQTSSQEPPGGNCSLGGTRVDSGLDDDGDGVLDAEEVDATRYVCDPATVSLSTPEPAGSHCEHGGTRVDSGPDDDGDGVLDSEEVELTTYACAPAPVTCELTENEDGTVTQTCTDGSTDTRGTARGCQSVPGLAPLGLLLLAGLHVRRRAAWRAE